MTDQPDHRDMTLDELRLYLAPMIADAAVFDGWGEEALAMTAEMADVDPDVARLAFKAGSASARSMVMIEAWIDHIDNAMAKQLTQDVLAQMKIRERIRALIAFRLEMVEGQEEAVRRALAIMAAPQNARRALQTGWRSADIMWRLAGDQATDYNHYTKRAILASIYGATLAVFVDDESEDKAETKAFLDRRIEGVMRFEKVKSQLLRPGAERFSMTRFLGRLRYPAR